jgi:hypothetical protein
MFAPDRARGVCRGAMLSCALALLLLPLLTLALPAHAAAAAAPKADMLGVTGNAFPWESHWADFQKLLNDSDAGWARLELRWDFIEANPGAWNFGLHDQLVDGYRADGMQVLGLLDYSVAWANGQPGSGTVFGPPTDLDAWSQYVSAVAQHFKGRVNAYEIWNEPDASFFWNGKDGGDPAAYLPLLQRAYQAIKAVDPTATVMNGGLTGTARGADFLNQLLDMGAGSYLDVVAFHGYVANDGLDTSVFPDVIWPLLGQARARAGKPLWITEFGWPSDCGDGSAACSEAAQANRVARNLAMLFKIGGVAKVFVFMFKDPGDQPNYYGITRADASPKPAFAAVQTIANRLAGLTYEGQVNLGSSDLWDMRFSAPDRTVDVVWSQAGDRDIQFPTSHTNVRTWRIDGARQDFTASAGSAQLHVTSDPLLVERDGQALITDGGSRCRYFAETNQSLCDGFLDFWQQYGGLMAFGYPISPELQEDGRTVQYLERMKFENHPEATGTAWAVMGELVGRTITAGRDREPAFQAVADPHDGGCNYYAETGHTLCLGFRAYWDQHGGLWMFGYPISQELQERNPDTGETYTVQYFERARFEWHPENAGTQYEVLLGRLGAQVFSSRY